MNVAGQLYFLSWYLERIQISGIPSTKHAPYITYGKLIHWCIQGIWMNVQTQDKNFIILNTVKTTSTHLISIQYVLWSRVVNFTAAHIWLFFIRVHPRTHRPSLNKKCHMEWTLNLKSMHGQNLIDFIHYRDLQYFWCNSHGSGCLTWCMHIIEELTGNHYIPMDTPAELSQKIAQFKCATYQIYYIPKECGVEFYIHDREQT